MPMATTVNRHPTNNNNNSTDCAALCVFSEHRQFVFTSRYVGD